MWRRKFQDSSVRVRTFILRHRGLVVSRKRSVTYCCMSVSALHFERESRPVFTPVILGWLGDTVPCFDPFELCLTYAIGILIS